MLLQAGESHSVKPKEYGAQERRPWKPWRNIQGSKAKIWVFPKFVVPQNGWFIMENLIKRDDLGYHYFGNMHIIQLKKEESSFEPKWS